MIRLLVFFMLFASVGARGDTTLPDDHAALVDDAIAALDSDLARKWSYVESATANERTTVGQFDPRRPDGDQWLLLTINGQAPTDAEINTYRESKQKDNDESSTDDGNDIRSLVARGSVEFVEETDDYWLFSFIPTDEDEDMKILKHVDASLRIVKDGRYIDLIDMHNSKPIKPAFGVKIMEFLMRLSFAPASLDGPVVPQTVDVRVRGRAFLLASFDEAESLAYSDYEYVVD